jgi:hypothetical protein
VKALKTIGLILWMGMGLGFMSRQGCFYYRGGGGAWVSQSQNIIAGIFIILSGAVALYTLYTNKSE